MHVEITCRHGHIKEDVRAYMAEKVEKLLTYFERITAINVTISFENSHAKVEILVDAEHKHDFVAHDSDAEAQVAFDRAHHKIEQQIHKYKEKVQNHHRHEPAKKLADEE
ncbi:MAG: ribosome-associated translation inhibitor RaiA [Planctomycetota bacterium]|nr:MAG: ribosome-associated translation inhibitor RaiA [Planctomycetota bacterium]GDY08779.1 hypothetical protein LBMAG52_22650 [Planctomycetia bacterium]